MNLSDEIRKQIEKNKALKLEVGEINNHLSILEGLVRKDIMEQVDEAYQKGLEEGKKAFDLLGAERDSEYQRGLSEGNDIGYKDGVKDGQNEAWECAKKLFSTMSETEIEKVFPTEWENGFYGLMQMKPQYAIDKLKAHEKKENEEIKVGDIIANNTEPKLKVWVTCFDEIGFCGIAITDFCTVDKGKLYASCSPKGWHKIGHFDINKILEGGAL